MTSRRLARLAVEKPWGVTQLPEAFGFQQGGRIGEICFVPPLGSPLLVKYLFTSERLSIQVHPDDAQARERGLSSGKSECWYILAAEPGAVVGIGTERPLDADALRVAAQSGKIEELMQWHPVQPGLFFYVPAGTVHAIGAGVSLVEIQQNVDTTYRLYDYGRPRELHLADGIEVARARSMPTELRRKIDVGRSQLLLESEHFNVAHVTAAGRALLDGVERPIMIVPLGGTVAAEGTSAGVGECLWVDNARTIDAGSDAHFVAGWAP